MTSEHELALAAVSGIRCGRAFLAILVSPGRVFGNFGVEIDGHSRRGLFWLPLVGRFGVNRIFGRVYARKLRDFCFFSLFWGDFVVFCFNWRRIIDFSWSRGAGSCL